MFGFRRKVYPFQARGVVKFFKEEQGWGAITCPDLPEGRDVWVHYSVIVGDGYRSMAAGDIVELKYQQIRQDSFDYRATWARRIETGPPPTLRRVGDQVVIAPPGTPDTPLTGRTD